MARPPKAPPPCHCHHEGTGIQPGKGPDGSDRRVDAIHCPRHKRWVELDPAKVTPAEIPAG